SRIGLIIIRPGKNARSIEQRATAGAELNAQLAVGENAVLRDAIGDALVVADRNTSFGVFGLCVVQVRLAGLRTNQFLAIFAVADCVHTRRIPSDEAFLNERF